MKAVVPRSETPRVRLITGATTFIVGTVLLTVALRMDPGDPAFPWLSLGVSAVWATGALVVSPVPLGRRRQVMPPVLLGLGLVAIFVLGALVVNQVPALSGPVARLLEHTTYSSMLVVWSIAMVTGVCEEMFFRGALFDLLPVRWAVWGSLALYTASTLGSGISLLILAAVVIGLVTALQRRVTGGIVEPVITHLTWSTGMIVLLPPLL